MRFKAKVKFEESFKQIFFVPFLNIILLLLLIFIFIAGFILEPGLRFSLPVSVLSSMVKFENIEVVIKADSSVYLNRNKISLKELGPIFKEAAKKQQTVLIKADNLAPLGRVSEICDYARLSGISQVNIATN